MNVDYSNQEEFAHESLPCGSLRISAFSVFKLHLTQRTQRYAEDAEKTL
jgi:hypothetical protein